MTRSCAAIVATLLAAVSSSTAVALPDGVSCNTAKTAVAKDRQILDAPEFEAPVVLARSEAIAPQGHEGEIVKVLVRVVVCTDGIPRTPTIVISGTKEFDAAAAHALTRWRFAPGKRFGVAAAMSYTALVSFGAPKEPAPPEAATVSEASPPRS